ncbi:MAG: FAD-dependent monooxygenase [Anaerolineales bacterium]|nr:FAD-dependent monooxygenase [Anaerolineales bacterium]
MKIMIVGGGIGGLTTAVALRQAGFAPLVYEAAPSLEPVGKGIWLPTNAMLVLERLGLAEALVALGIELTAIEVHDRATGRLQAIDLAAVKAHFGRTTTSILRADLQATLAAALPAESIQLGKRCVAVQQAEAGVTVTFADGSTAAADLLIGADGLRSVVRDQVAPGVQLRDSGQRCFLGVADVRLPAGQHTVVREIWGGIYRFGYSPVTPDKVYWFAPIAAPEPIFGGAEPLAALQQAYAAFPDPVADILAHTDPAQIILVPLKDILPQKRWYAGRVVLLGDAAHAMTPNLGQGGAQAIEDGYFLAWLLAEKPTVEAALAAYQAGRRPRAQRIASQAWRIGQLAHLTSAPARFLRNTAFRLVPASLGQRQAEALYKLDF